MYKTVRQGENSLQYTILPQTEEVLTSSGAKGKGRDYSPPAPPRKMPLRLVIYYIAVILLMILLLLGALLVIFLSAGFFPNFLPKTAEIRGSKTLGSIIFGEQSSWHKLMDTNAPNDPMANNSNKIKNVNVLNKTTVIPTTVLPTTVYISSTSTERSVTQKEWILPALKRLQSSTTVETVAEEKTATNKMTTAEIFNEKMSTSYGRMRESNGDLMLGHDQLNWKDYDDGTDDYDYDITKPFTTPVVNTNKPPLMINKLSKATNIKTTSQPTVTPLKPTTIASNRVPSDVTDAGNQQEKNKTAKTPSAKFLEMKEHILDDDDEEYKEALTDQDDVMEKIVRDDVKMSQAKSSWLQTRWPFVDPSSYFQWTDYSARDNLLLPAILSAALSALMVLGVLCYALRRRQRCRKRIQEIGNLTSELQAEDNAILLTAENPSEED